MNRFLRWSDEATALELVSYRLSKICSWAACLISGKLSKILALWHGPLVV